MKRWEKIKFSIHRVRTLVASRLCYYYSVLKGQYFIFVIHGYLPFVATDMSHMISVNAQEAWVSGSFLGNMLLFKCVMLHPFATQESLRNENKNT